ncbi:fimbrillin family protein [Bacteroides sp.]|uniref:fimbrillin family protein n=1 Tax=Bacteroides sp. TaxID=29523 RepID=UPI003AB6DE3A
MKNLLNISALLCAVALATSCSNEEIVENGTAVDGFTLVATTGADTRTTVDDDYKVTWTTGDAFYVFGNNTKDKTYSSRGTLTLKGAGGATGTFEGTVIGTVSKLQYAVYPADNYDSGTMTLTFPDKYIYPVSNAPMFGKVNVGAGKVAFEQLLCGMMRVTLNGLKEGAEGSLTLTSSNTYITGSAPLTIGTNGKATLSSLSDNKGQMITLTFKNEGATGSLLLDIPLPAATYGNDLTATLKIGEAEVEAFTTEADFEITDSEIKVMTELTIAKIDGTTISFTKNVASSEDANKELTAGAKNVTIAAMGSGSALEIPNNSSAADPVTINVSAATTENFTVKGAQGGTTEAIKINLPTGSKGTVTVENIKSVEISGGWDQTSGTSGDPLVIAAGTGVEELTVKDIEHVEVSGTWKKATASTGDNTFVVKADAVIEDLTVEKGNIKIEDDGVVNKLTLNNDVTINRPFYVPVRETMAINLGTHQLTLVGDENCDKKKNHVRIYEGASLTITGDASGKGKILDQTRGISAADSDTKLTMENVIYTTDHDDTDGIFLNEQVSRASIDIKNSTIHSLYFCVSTNASAPVGSGNTIKLTDCTLVGETALLVNTPVTVTAKNCSFTGDWHAAFLRGGTSTFENCSFNLSVNNNNINTHTTWGTGNEVPSAAITAGNRNNNDTDYNYKTTLALKNNCTFTVKKDGETSTDYPAIYLDAKENVATQGVTFTYDESCKAAVEAAGALVIKNTNGEVTVNGEAYKGSGDDVPE